MFLTSQATGLGKKGIAIKYFSALQVQRHVWISDAFKAKHAAIANCIQQCVTAGPCVWAGWDQTPSKWSMFPSVHEFAALKARHLYSASVCALIVKSGGGSAGLAGLGHLFDGPNFLDLIRRLDVEHNYYNRR